MFGGQCDDEKDAGFRILFRKNISVCFRADSCFIVQMVKDQYNE